MTGLLHDVARAALPVAAALLVCAGAARVALWMDLDDERLKYVARQYLPPLIGWCLGAVAVYAIALGGAGEAGLAALALAAGIGAAAVLLRAPDGESRTEEAGGGADPRAQTRPLGDDVVVARAETRPRPAAGASLWQEPAEDSARTGLWSR
jgi:hypothetical protein